MPVCTALGIALLVVVSAGTGTQPAALVKEFDRLSRALATSVPEPDRAGLASRLARGQAALEAGDVYVALYDLQTVYEGEGGYRVAGTAKSIPNAAGFKARWTALGTPA